MSPELRFEVLAAVQTSIAVYWVVPPFRKNLSLNIPVVVE
jgi:hypothetical protein